MNESPIRDIVSENVLIRIDRMSIFGQILVSSIIFIITIYFILTYSYKGSTSKSLVPSKLPLQEKKEILFADETQKLLLGSPGCTVMGFFKLENGDRTMKYKNSFIPLLQVENNWFLEIAPGPVEKDKISARLRVQIKSMTEDKQEVIDLPPIPKQRWVFIAILREGRRFDIIYDDQIVASQRLENYPVVISSPLSVGNKGLGGSVVSVMVEGQRLSIDEVKKKKSNKESSFSSLVGLGSFDVTMPSFKSLVPKIDPRFPSIDLRLPNINAPRFPNINFSLPNVNFPGIPAISLPRMPNINISIPDINLPNMPNIDISIPNINLPGAPNINVPGLPEVGFPRAPNINMPGLPDVNLPGMPNVNLPGLPDVNLPNLPNVTLPNLPNVSVPGLPDVTLPTLPNINVPGLPNVSVPRWPDVTVPSIPDVNIPRIPNVGLPGMPNIDMPRVPNIDLDVSCPPGLPCDSINKPPGDQIFEWSSPYA